MPASRPSISRAAILAGAFGALFVAAPPALLGADRPTIPDPDDIARVVDARLHGRLPALPARDGSPQTTVVTSGSGAVAAVQVCDEEVQAATIAGGTDAAGILSAVGGGCADADNANGALTVAGSGAFAAATEGAAVTAPAGSLGVLPALAAAPSAVPAAPAAPAFWTTEDSGPTPLRLHPL